MERTTNSIAQFLNHMVNLLNYFVPKFHKWFTSPACEKTQKQFSTNSLFSLHEFLLHDGSTQGKVNFAIHLVKQAQIKCGTLFLWSQVGRGQIH